MEPQEPRQRLDPDQKRVLVVLAIIAILIAVVAIGLALLATSIGVPFWIAAVLGVIIAAVIGLFMFLNLA